MNPFFEDLFQRRFYVRIHVQYFWSHFRHFVWFYFSHHFLRNRNLMICIFLSRYRICALQDCSFYCHFHFPFWQKNAYNFFLNICCFSNSFWDYLQTGYLLLKIGCNIRHFQFWYTYLCQIHQANNSLFWVDSFQMHLGHHYHFGQRTLFLWATGCHFAFWSRHYCLWYSYLEILKTDNMQLWARNLRFNLVCQLYTFYFNGNFNMK